MRKLLLFGAVMLFAMGYAIGHFRGNSTGYSAGFRDSLAIVGPIQEHQFAKYGNTSYKLDYRTHSGIVFIHLS